MEVVEDQGHLRVLGSKCRCQPQQEQILRRPPPRGGQRPGNGNTRPAQCGDDIGQEHPWPVVIVVQAEPGDRPGLCRRPQCQGHRLARADRAGDHGQRAAPHTLGDQCGDPRPLHRPVRHTRWGEPGWEDRVPPRTAARLVRVATRGAAWVAIWTSRSHRCRWPVLAAAETTPWDSRRRSTSPDGGRCPHHDKHHPPGLRLIQSVRNPDPCGGFVSNRPVPPVRSRCHIRARRPHRGRRRRPG